MLIVLIMHGTCVVTSAFIYVTPLNYSHFFPPAACKKDLGSLVSEGVQGLSSVHFSVVLGAA